MYQGLIQEAEDNFASEGLCSFVVEGRYCSSSVPAAAPGIQCLSILAGHVPGNQVAVVVGDVLVALTIPGTALVALDIDMVGSDTALGLGTQAGIRDFFAPSASTELKPMPCHQ